MFPISFSTLGCPAWSWTTILEQAVKLGYAGIELRGLEGEMDLTRRREFSALHLAGTKRALGDRGLTVPALGASTRLHEPDPQVLAAQMDEARRFVDLAHRLGAPWVRVFPDRFVPGESKESTIARVGDNLASLGRFARGSGVGILVESHGEFVDSASLSAMMRAAGEAPAIGLLWDTHHTIATGKEAASTTWTGLGQWVRHTHIKDSVPDGTGVRYVLTGEGAIGIRDVVGTLARGGYRGLYGFEWEKRWHPSLADPEIAFPQYAEVMRRYLSEAGVAAG